MFLLDFAKTLCGLYSDDFILAILVSTLKIVNAKHLVNVGAIRRKTSVLIVILSLTLALSYFVRASCLVDSCMRFVVEDVSGHEVRVGNLALLGDF